MVLMDFDVGREVGVQAWLIGRVETKDEVAFEVSRVVEMGSRGQNEMEFETYHVDKVCLVDNEERGT